MCNCQEFKANGKCKFHNKDGSLTRYAFACGYQELTELPKTRIRTKLFWDSCCYAVIQYDDKEGKRLCWETFTRLKDARKFYKESLKNC